MTVIEFILNTKIPGGLSSFHLKRNEVLEFIPDVLYLVDSGAVTLATKNLVSQRVAYALLGRDESPNLYLTVQKERKDRKDHNRLTLIGESEKSHVLATPAHYLRNALDERSLEEQGQILHDLGQRLADTLIHTQMRVAYLKRATLFERVVWFERYYDRTKYLEPNETWSHKTLARQLWAANAGEIADVKREIAEIEKRRQSLN